MKRIVTFLLCFFIALNVGPFSVVFANDTQGTEKAGVIIPAIVGKSDTGGLDISIEAVLDEENILKAYEIDARSTWSAYSSLRLNITDVVNKAIALGEKMPEVYVVSDFVKVILNKNIIRELRSVIPKQEVFLVLKKNDNLSEDIMKKMSSGKFEVSCSFENQIQEEIPITKKFNIEIPYIAGENNNVQLYSVNGSAVIFKKSTTENGAIGCQVSSKERILFSEGVVVMITGRTLDLQGTISMIFYASLEGVKASTARMLFWDSPQDEYTLETAQRVVEYSGSDANGYRFEYDNISSVDMNKKIYARIVAKDNNGNTVYGSVPYVGYSIVTYAENMMTNQQLRPLLVKMLNYGAAAQEYFGSDRKPANSILAETEKVMDFTKLYVSQAKTIEEKTRNGKCNAQIIGKTLSLEGDISINYYVSDEKNVDEMGVLFWTEDSYKKTNSHIAGTQSFVVKDYAISDRYKIYTFDNIVSSKMFDNVYARVYTKVGNTYKYSDIDKYSVRDYAANQISKSSDTLLKNLLRRLLIYGDEARRYFKIING
ncbi:MAG: hypothetical protein IJW15_05735 [Clostridia bacterium]|nr:hypothetical protein [Clostridia bacterium]